MSVAHRPHALQVPTRPQGPLRSLSAHPQPTQSPSTTQGISLPPDLQGPVRGEVILQVVGLSLSSGSLPRQRAVVCVKWWGEQGHGSLFRAASDSLMVYPVHAPFEKLVQYFRDAEVLRFDVADSGSRVVLGRALLSISNIDASHAYSGVLPIISTLGERKIGELTVSLQAIPFFPASTPRPPSPSDSSSQDRSFQHYERLAAADESGLPLYPSPTTNRPAIYKQQQEHPHTSAGLPTSPTPKNLTTVQKQVNSKSAANVPAPANTGVIADLLQRGLKLREAMTNSAKTSDSFAASSVANVAEISKDKGFEPANMTFSDHNGIDEYAYTHSVDDSLDAVREILAAQDRAATSAEGGFCLSGESAVPVLAMVEDPSVRTSLLSDVGIAEDVLLRDVFFGNKIVNKKPKIPIQQPHDNVKVAEVAQHRRGIYVHIQTIKLESTSLFEFSEKRNIYVTCRIFSGPEYITKTRVQWGMRNPTWNHRSIFSIPPNHTGWSSHLSSNSMILEVWDRPLPGFADKGKKARPSTDSSDRLVGIATVSLQNHLGHDVLQLASPYTPHPVRDVVSGGNAGYIFLGASIGPFQSIHSLFKIHAVRILQRTWRKKLQSKILPQPKPLPIPVEPSTPSKKTSRRTAPVHTTPAPRKTAASSSPSHIPHITTTNVLPHHATLSINILQARLQKLTSFKKPPNCFVVYALPAGIGEPQATSIRYSTTNPIWNHSYSISLVLDQQTVSVLHQPHKYVTFEIWHKYDIQSRPVLAEHELLLGSASLPLASLLDASKRSADTRASIDIYASSPGTRTIGTLEVEYSLSPASSALPEQLTSSHEWVINTLTKYKQVPYPKSSVDNGEDYDIQQNNEPSDVGEDLTELDNQYNYHYHHSTDTPEYDQDLFIPHKKPGHKLSPDFSAPTPTYAAAPHLPNSAPNPNPNSEWKWLSELDKELSIQTDLILKTRHAKNMLELDALLNKLNCDTSTEIAQESGSDQYEQDYDVNLVDKIRVRRNVPPEPTHDYHSSLTPNPSSLSSPPRSPSQLHNHLSRHSPQQHSDHSSHFPSSFPPTEVSMQTPPRSRGPLQSPPLSPPQNPPFAPQSPKPKSQSPQSPQASPPPQSLSQSPPQTPSQNPLQSPPQSPLSQHPPRIIETQQQPLPPSQPRQGQLYRISQLPQSLPHEYDQPPVVSVTLSAALLVNRPTSSAAPQSEVNRQSLMQPLQNGKPKGSAIRPHTRPVSPPTTRSMNPPSARPVSPPTTRSISPPSARPVSPPTTRSSSARPMRPPHTRTVITHAKWDAETERIAKILKGS